MTDQTQAKVMQTEAEQLAHDVATFLQPISGFTSIVFRDLVDLAQRNPKVFDELYYGREAESRRFEAILEDVQHTAVNVIVVGDAGTGKSNFIYKIVRHTNLLGNLRVHPITVDYRAKMPSTANGCLIQFIRDLRDYFAAIGEPIHTLAEYSDGMITYNMQMCYKHLESIPKDRLAKHLLIVLDDFDYAEADWFTMLDFFQSFAASSKASVVFTLRPVLLATVEKFDDRFTHYYVRNCHKIDLQPLEVSRVLASRLALLLALKEERTLYARIRDRIRGNCSGLLDVLKQLGLTDIDMLPQFDYPFSEHHNTFMSRITNGNLREVFDIAMDSLVYMFDRRNRATVTQENGADRRHIGRQGDINLFMKGYDRKVTPYKMVNLHNHRARNGNSVLYNVLEMIQLRRVVDDTFYEIAKVYGHLRKDVDYALGELSDKANRMICPTRLRPAKAGTLEYDVPEYYVTDKGDFYLKICDWDEYRAQCGECGVSIRKDYKP
jgi:hypothetical protein